MNQNKPTPRLYQLQHWFENWKTGERLSFCGI